MKQFYRFFGYLSIILLVSIGCKKRSGMPEEPELSGRLSFDITFPSSWRWIESTTRSQTLQKHIVAEVWSGNMRMARQEWNVNIKEEEALLELGASLKPATYNVLLWTDICPEGATGVYDTSSLLRVKTNAEQGLESDMRDCAYASVMVTTRGENLTTLHLSLSRPVGRWRLICENEKEVLSMLNTLAPKGGPYKVVLTYNSPIVTVYDVSAQMASSMREGLTVSGYFEPFDMAGVQTALLSDWLLLEPEGDIIQATLSFCDKVGNPLIVHENVMLEMKAAQALTLRVRVRNDGINTGFTIDSEWEGEDVIEL